MRFRASLLALTSVAMLTSVGTAQARALRASTTGCATEYLTRPFLRWGDLNQYTLVPGGGFESGQQAWTLSGGAAVLFGNEPWHVRSLSDSYGLMLPPGSSAVSPPMCISMNDPDLRFFATEWGSLTSSGLAVSVTIKPLSGLPVTLRVGTLTPAHSWLPTPAYLMLVNLLAYGSGAKVQFRFQPSGTGNWQIDDVYVDPFGRV